MARNLNHLWSIQFVTQQINTAFDRMLKGDVKYRFVIDMKTIKG